MPGGGTIQNWKQTSRTKSGHYTITLAEDTKEEIPYLTTQLHAVLDQVEGLRDKYSGTPAQGGQWYTHT